jgi:predicted dehydrogenase
VVKESSVSSQIRAGVIGTGSIGRNHARIFSEMKDAQFTAIYDTNPVTAQEMAARFRTRAAASLEEFASLVDAATVATPTPTHFPIGKFLLEQGKHVLVEKPITETTEDARALADLAHERGLVLQVGHIERFNPVLGALESQLARPRFIESHRLSPYPNRSTEIGVVLDLMIHDLEIILHLVRSPCKASMRSACQS